MIKEKSTTTSKKPAAKRVSKPAGETAPVAEAEAKTVKRVAKKPVSKAADPAPEPAEEVSKPALAPAVAVAPPVETAPVTAPAPVAAAPKEEASADSKIINMKPPIPVRDLASRMNVKPFQLIHHLMEMNVFATLTQTLEEEVARKLCSKFGYTLEVEKRKEGGGVHKPEKPVDPLLVQPPIEEKPEKKVSQELPLRPPIITFMGHVDHGKTSLLDAIRSARVAAGEAGGITQHIGAYTVQRNGHTITFLDTPGHEAFTAMRARGATVTDIVILVVAADDGLMPQTLEAISHAKAAGVSIMVAINKVDLPSANVLKVKSQLQEHGLVPEDFGGDTICCEVSATKKIGIEKLLEMMLLQAEVLELRANPKGAARGRVIESQFEVGRGATATVLVQSGTLNVGDIMLAGPYYGRVKALIDDQGHGVKEAGPSIPVKVLGLDGACSPGEEFTVMKNDREARDIADERRAKARLGKLDSSRSVTLENLFSTIADDQAKVLNLVIKGDVQGSVEAVVASLKKIESKKISLDIIHSAAGSISESDVILAKASGAVVIGFNTKTENSAANAAKRETVQIKLYSIIYELIDQVKEAMVGLLDPETRETTIGTAIVKQVFELSKYPVAGCMIQTGRVTRNARARVIRRKQPIYDGGVQTLKRFQDEASEVRAGMECGIRLGDFTEYEEGDIIECYVLDKVAQTL